MTGKNQPDAVTSGHNDYTGSGISQKGVSKMLDLVLRFSGQIFREEVIQGEVVDEIERCQPVVVKSLLITFDTPEEQKNWADYMRQQYEKRRANGCQF
jgi:hypothetical protein